MQNDTDLTGQWAMVHSALPAGPDTRPNEIGKILSADVDSDEFLIGFTDHTRLLYGSDALLLLKPGDEIHQVLADKGELLSYPDLKALTHLDLALRFASGDRQYSALELAVKNPDIQPLCLDLLQDRLANRQSQFLKR